MVEMARKSTFISNNKCGIARFMVDEDGATAIEYALIASGIAAAIVSIVFGLGGTITTSLYDKVATGLR
jgi:pilus assembly protein Flp/PilA